MKVCITGSGGYIGSIATYVFLRSGHSVLALDSFERGYKEPLDLLASKYPGKLTYKKVDLFSDKNVYDKKDNIDVVLHFAARCIVDESVRHPEKYIPYNEQLLENILHTMAVTDTKHIVLSSTAAVYGEPKHVPVAESSELSPINPYGESKLRSEELLQNRATALNISYVIFRYFNVCGASDDGLIGDSKKPSELLVQNAVRGALGIDDFNLTCSKVATPDGSPIRDFIDVSDLANAHLMAAEYLLRGGSSDFLNIGTQKGMSVLEIVKSVELLTGKRIAIHSFADKKRLGEQAMMISDVSRAEKILHWKSKRSINDSVDSLIKWYEKHPKGWSY